MIIWSKLLKNVDIIIKLLGGLAIISLALLAKCNGDNADMYLHRVEEMREIHTEELNSAGETVYVTKMEYYTSDNIKDSKDPIIIQLLTSLDNLKLRKTENLFKADAHTNIEYITNTIRDTVILRDSILIHAKEYDVYDNGILSMERIVTEGDTGIAYYAYDYKPTISGAISWHKPGKWKIKNLWSWRDKIWDLNLVSNDSNMVIENTKFIYVGNKKD